MLCTLLLERLMFLIRRSALSIKYWKADQPMFALKWASFRSLTNITWKSRPRRPTLPNALLSSASSSFTSTISRRPQPKVNWSVESKCSSPMSHSSAVSRRLTNFSFFLTLIKLGRLKARSWSWRRMIRWLRYLIRIRIRFSIMRRRCSNSVSKNSSLTKRVTTSTCSWFQLNWSRKFSWRGTSTLAKPTIFWARFRRRSCQCNLRSLSISFWQMILISWWEKSFTKPKRCFKARLFATFA